MQAFYSENGLRCNVILSIVIFILTFVLLFLVFPFLKYNYFIKTSKKADKSNCRLLKFQGNVRFIKAYEVIFIGAFLSALCLFWNTLDTPKDTVSRIVQPIVDTFRLFTLELRLPELKEKFLSQGKEVLDVKFSDLELNISETGNIISTSRISNIYLPLLALLAPFCTAYTAVSLLFNDLLVQVKYWLTFRNVFVLSELNENSLCLAKDIRKNHSYSMIIFMDVSKKSSEDDSDDLLNKIKEINASTTKKSVTDFHFFCCKKTHIFLIDKEEKNNVKNGKTLFGKYRKKNIIINVFSTLKSAETFMKNISKNSAETKANIHHINIAKMIAYRILLEHPLYDIAARTNDKKISVLVVGSGAISNECAKTAVWCGATDESNFKIRIISNKKEDPGFKNLRENSQSVGMNIDYKFFDFDIENDDFSGISSEIDSTNYIIVETENDELTVNTALKLRRYFVRNAVKSQKYDSEKIPAVIPIIKSSDYIELLGDNKENKYVYPFGCNSDVYNETSINNYIVNNPDIVVHSVYKLKEMGVHITLSEFENEHMILFDELAKFLKSEFVKKRKDRLPEIEHKRWTVMRLLEGWITSDISQLKKNNINEHKNTEAMINAALVKYSKLKDIGKQMYNDENWLIKYNESVAASVEFDAINAIAPNIKEYNIYISEEDYGELQTESC